MIEDIARVPVIGLPVQLKPGTGRQYLSRDYTDAILAAGGLPIVIPLLKTPESLRHLSGRLDGVLLTGSNTDIDPAVYSAVREDACGPVEPLRDRTDFLLLRLAAERRIPVLSICFGMQSLNVFTGGSLIQDIPSHLKTRIKHSNPRSNGKPCHDVDLRPGSLLEDLAGGSASRVNSTHHQAVSRVGRGLEVIARAPDGVIEAVIGTDPGQWILGVQWHPEKSFAFDDFSRRIFGRFLQSCQFKRESYEGTHS